MSTIPPRWVKALLPGVCGRCGRVYLTGARLLPDLGGYRCSCQPTPKANREAA